MQYFSAAGLAVSHGCLFTFLVFNVIALLFLAQISHAVGYLVIPTRTALRSAKMSNNQLLHYTTDFGLALVVVFPVTSLFVTKWRGVASIRSRVLRNHC